MQDTGMTDIAVILSHKRSGSHLLGHALGSHPEICYIDELTRHVKTGNLGRFDTGADVERYLQQIRARKCPESLLLVDIKYGMVHFNQAALEAFLRQSLVIHLYRTDYKAWWYSRKHAEVRKRQRTAEYAKGVERTEITKPPPAPTVELEQDRLRKAERRLKGQQTYFGRFATYSLTYEDLTGGKEVRRLPEREGRILCAVLGVEYQPLIAQTRKMSPANYNRRFKV